MRYLVFFLLILFFHQSFAQKRDKPDFKYGVRSVKTTLDGKKLIIKSFRWHRPGSGPYTREYLIYDFESESIRFFEKVGPYGGFSPNAKYFLNTKLSYLHMKKSPYESKLLNMETNKELSWKNEHFALAVYDDGNVLATKAKTVKSIAKVSRFQTLYLYNPKGGKPQELIGKKESLENEIYGKDQGIDADPKFFQLLSPDNLTSWGGNIYNTDYRTTSFNVYDLTTGSKKEVRVNFPDTTKLPKNLVLMVDGESAMMRRGSRGNDAQWQDYFIHAGSEKAVAMSSHETHKTPVQYQMLNDKLYQFDNENGVIMRFNTSSGLPVSDKVWYPKIPQGMLIGQYYRYAVAADKYLVAVPSKRLEEVGDVIIYDLETNAVVDNFSLYQKEKPKEAASSYSTKTLYKSDLLNSYDRLSLPYTLGNPSGRQVTGLSGASSIGGGGQVFAIGQIGSTASGNLILLSLSRYTASNGSEVSTYYVSIFDKDGNYKNGKEIGNVQRSSVGRTYAVVNFKIQREPYNTFSIVGEQQFEQRKTAFKITIEPTGNIH